MQQIILVELRTPYNGRTRYAFGCKKAIYDVLPANIVGIALTTLQARYDLQQPYENTKCIIRKVELHRTPTNRGRKT